MAKTLRERAQKTKELILRTAEEEFAKKGFYGARVDEIAKESGVNKRMIYQYFAGKEELYKTVLYNAYSKIAKAEEEIFVRYDTHEEAIRRVITLYFTYLKSNPNYVSLVLWENLNEGEYIKGLDFSAVRNKLYDYIAKTLAEGKANGEFREDFSDNQIIISILTFTFSYFSNRYTLSKLLEGVVDYDKDFEKRIENVTQMIIQYIKK